MPVRGAVVIGGVMSERDDLVELSRSLADAAEALLPLARESSWPFRLEVMAWLTAVRDRLSGLSDQSIH